jgi:hypothetical protein
MSSPGTIAALVEEGSANIPALASRLARAADVLRENPPFKVAPHAARLWHAPSSQRERVLYLVDRLDGTCTCPDFRQYRNTRDNGRRRGAPSGWCKHRLAVEMLCRLNREAQPNEQERNRQ